MRKQFDNDHFQFGFELALGAAYRQGSDAGEVLTTLDRITDGDSDSWVREWTATAERLQAFASEAETQGHEISALAYHRRAATYFGTALYCFSGTTDPSYGRELELWRRQQASWERVVDLMGAERLSIPYEKTMLPGLFFRAPDTEPGESRPLVVMNNGSDGATSSMWGEGGAGAAERGYHWMTFDGPGQQATLFEQAIPFRPDWEAVLTPVLDTMLARPDVDRDHVAVIGMSQAGFWVPRAICFEHRFAAAVADTGVVDVSAGWFSQLSDDMLELLRDHKREEFDSLAKAIVDEMPSVRATLEFRGRPYGVGADSFYDLFQTVAGYRLGDEVASITTPLLITDPEDEHFFPGQPQQLYDLVECPKDIVRFTANEGANGHCEPMARSLRDTRVFDWLDKYLK